ncbi:MAG: hypothetical protein HRT41_13435 [Campylobacteraceae bacterium]|nr:hypothetical protein [Campylobacteraceae bacterium]
MKKQLKQSLILLSTVFFFTACSSNYGNMASSPSYDGVANLNTKNVCSVKNNGIQNVLDTAVKYNAVAIKNDLEFMRLGMRNSQYISAINMALKTGSKNIDILNKKKKKTGSVSVEYATWRACSFSIAALQQAQDAKTTWRLAVPGDGFTY